VRARVELGAKGAVALLLGTVLAPLAGAQEAFPPAVPSYPTAPGPVGVMNPAPMELKVRRVKDAVEVVIENTGSGPQLEQSTGGGSWLGRLYTSRPSILQGPQMVGVPDAGFERISIEGDGTVYNLRVTPVAGYPVRPPLVSADGRNVVLSFAAPAMPSLQTLRRDTLAPGAVANPNFVPPLRQRAAAPPVGDMAVGTMVLKDPSYLDVRGPRVTLTFKGVPASNAMHALARIGKYGFVYNSISDKTKNPPVTASFFREDYRTAINMVIASTGIQAKLVGNTIIAGPDALSTGAASLASKVYRLNQVSARSAAEYLASLGALIRVPKTYSSTEASGSSTNVGGGSLDGGQTASNTFSTTSTGTAIDSYGGQKGPLQGLSGTIDRRLGTITLVGKPSLVSVAEQYLKQIDLRQRQVALSIKILDVSLGNGQTIDNSFAFRYGNNFIVSDSGQLIGAFGGLLPPNGASDQFEILSGGASNAKPIYPPSGETRIPRAPLSPAPINPGNAYIRNNFYDLVKAQITSSSTKVLASPTLILSENSEDGGNQNNQSSAKISGDESSFLGSVTTNQLVTMIGRAKSNESAVVVGERIITGYKITGGNNGSPNSCEPTFGIAGLTFGARVTKVDDNGFVTFSLSPTISATSGEAIITGCGSVALLTLRSLDTGSARVRDGQTLILTGVLSDRDRQLARKWPLLADLPIVGQFFRTSENAREKRELVVMVTPRIINDTEGGTYGYGYEPTSNDTRQFMSPYISTPMPSAFPQR